MEKSTALEIDRFIRRAATAYRHLPETLKPIDPEEVFQFLEDVLDAEYPMRAIRPEEEA